MNTQGAPDSRLPAGSQFERLVESRREMPPAVMASALEHPTVRLTRADVARLLATADSGVALDLRGTDLRGADLGGMNLAGADLRTAQMQRAKLAHTNLSEARLDEANLDAADLRGAILTEATLDQAQLSGTHLEGAALQGASLVEAHLAHANLEGARLRGARLDGATLWGTRLRGAELDGAHFGGADLHEADLYGAFLAGCALADADLALLRWDGLRAGEELAAERAPLTERPEAYTAAADAYRRLRQACTAQGLYDRAGEIYRREMRMRRKAHGYTVLAALWGASLPRMIPPGAFTVLAVLSVPLARMRRAARPVWHLLEPLITQIHAAMRAVRLAWRAICRPAVRWLWYVTLETLCGYGERVGRVLVAAVVVIVGMAVVYLRLGQLTEANGHVVTSFWHALYFSVCSFTSIGYATFAPNAAGLSKWLGVTESFTGNFLLALFLVTFTRKLTR